MIRLDSPPTATNNTGVLKSVLTLWYVLATLLGPGVCCCSWVSAKANTQPHGLPSAPKPTKSCCSPPAAPTCGEHARGDKPSGDPSKCPCKQNTKAVESNVAAAVAPDVAAQLRLAECVAVTFVLFDATVTALVSQSAVPIAGAMPLGGRALLAAYHILRC